MWGKRVGELSFGRFLHMFLTAKTFRSWLMECMCQSASKPILIYMSLVFVNCHFIHQCHTLCHAACIYFEISIQSSFNRNPSYTIIYKGVFSIPKNYLFCLEMREEFTLPRVSFRLIHKSNRGGLVMKSGLYLGPRRCLFLFYNSQNLQVLRLS